MASNELSIANQMSATLQNVQDEVNAPSALMISTNAVQIEAPSGAPAGHSLIVKAPPATGHAPSVLLHSSSPESGVRFTATYPDKPALNDRAFHLGLGGYAGPGTFFFFTTEQGIVMKIEQDGDVRIEKNLSIGGQLSVDGRQVRLQNVPPATAVLKHLMIDPTTGQLYTQ